MTPRDVSKARLIWQYLLDKDDAGLLAWRAWAEETILAIDFTPPFWLCELTVAASTHEALACVREGIGLNYGDVPASDIDEASFLFGLLYLQFARDASLVQEAWRVMAACGDVAEYVDAGHWRRYQRHGGIDVAQMSPEESTAAIFRPVAAYAVRTMRTTFGASPHVRAFMRRLTAPL
jgi:hypothetical protein